MEQDADRGAPLEAERDAPPLPRPPTPGPVPATVDQAVVRIGRAEREVAEQRLRQALTDDVLTIHEFDERCGKVYAARTQAELDQLLADLPAPSPAGPAGARTRTTPVKDRILGIFSGTEQRGRWRPAKPVRAVAVVGEVKVDLRDAESDDGEFVVTANTFMGSVDVIVPDDAEVDLGGVAIMGERANRVPSSGTSTGPLVRVNGFAFMGGVKVRTASKRERKKYPVSGESPQRPEFDPRDAEHTPNPPRRSPVGRIAAAAVAALLILGPGRAFVTADERVMFGSDSVSVSPEQMRGEDDIDVFVMFGSIDVPIERGTYTQEDVTSPFGSSECEVVCDPPVQDNPVVVDGFVMFGSANIGPPDLLGEEDDDED